ncbi:ovochymase-2-like [Rhipicephalus sanguineus]|uniref:ovochymase-2-like n=1 Tax=Rhipicephalus sanguineus TaxID=34632 RepID=UPI001895D48D|nr:ovochymase-2-like [Rhipicephalus sanguineus]
MAASSVLALLLLASVSPRGGSCCRTEHFPIPSQCGSEGGIPLGSAHSLPWMVTVRAEAMTDVQNPEDLLPCPGVFPSAARDDGSPDRQPRKGPDSFFGHLARVAVTHRMTSTCAGALVTARHVLTAAHCLFASRYKPTYRVFLRNGSSAGKHARSYASVPVSAALCHPGCRFHGTTRAINDLAVLVLAEPLDIQGSGGVGPLCLPWPDVPVQGSVLWMARHEGRTKLGSASGGAGRLPSVLTRESVQLVNCSLLPQVSHDTDGDFSSELCAVGIGGLREVVDPGTALMVDTVQGWVLVGLLSWLDDTRAVSSVAVFTDVRALMAWLLETLFKTF